MKVVHSPDLFETYPLHMTGAARVQVNEASLNLPSSAEMLDGRVGPEWEHRVAKSIAAWEETFSRMGAKPKYRSSLAQLYSGYLEHGVVTSKHPIVSFYNTLSLALAAPMAAYDCAQISGDLVLRLSGSDIRHLSFTPLGRPRENQGGMKSGEVGYVDEKRIVCRYWNLGDSDVTKLTDRTRDILFIVDLIDDENGLATQTFDGFVESIMNHFGPESLAGHGAATSRTSCVIDVN